MNYRKIYDALVERAQQRKIEGYMEKHHIIPRCLQGSDETANIVLLTAREHYLAHLLLVKMHPGNQKLIYAAAMMCSSSGRLRRTENRQYEWLKIQRSSAMSILHKGKTVSEETRQKIREKNKNYRPTEEARRKQSAAQMGKITSAETKEKISKSNTGGKSRKGQLWITDGTKNTSIYPENLQEWLDKGWWRGRSQYIN